MNIGEHWWTLVNIGEYLGMMRSPGSCRPKSLRESSRAKEQRMWRWSYWSYWSYYHLVIILWSSWSFVDPQMRFMDIEDELKVVGQNQQTLEVDFLFIKWLGWYDGRWEPIFIIRNKFLWWWPILSDRINNLEIFLDFQLISFLSGSKSIFLFDWTFEELKKAPFHLFNDIWKIWKVYFFILKR